jgi:serine/threonine protein kinase
VGGQGEVYRARDTRLNRTVAIRVLSAHFSDNAEMKARFEREVQTIFSSSAFLPERLFKRLSIA